MNIFHLPFSYFSPAPTASSVRERPGRVAELHGIIIQCDASSFIGKLFIRPLEALDLWYAGMLDRNRGREAEGSRSGLGMHAGIHVELEDGRHFVIEQLVGGLRDLFVDGLHWTPFDEFEGREGNGVGGWNATIPPEQLRQVDEAAVAATVARLNRIGGKPFFSEDCTGFIGRVFGPERRIFADSPVLRALGFDMRSGEPALPLIGRRATLNSESERLLRAKVLRDLPDPEAESGSTSLRQLHHRLLFVGMVCTIAAFFWSLLVPKRRSGS